MRYLLFIAVAAAILAGCRERTAGDQLSAEMQLLARELELKEQELKLKQAELELLREQLSREDLSLPEIYDRVKEAVYIIHTKKEFGVSQGSAFVIAPNGTAISNYHVFRNASEVIAVNESGEEYLITQILHFNAEDDWIIFKIGPNNGDMAYIEISGELPEVGEDCFTVGNPKGFTQSLSDGLVSAFRENHRLIQTTTEITHGSSGGPLFNQAGHVVGITSSGYQKSNLNFAININSLPISQYISRSPADGMALSSYELIVLLSSYYRHLVREDLDKLENTYNHTLARYHTLFNISQQQAIQDHRDYLKKYDIIRANIMSNTIDIQYNGDTYFITYDLDWGIKRRSDNKEMDYIETVVEVHPNGCISSIYDNILKKKNS